MGFSGATRNNSAGGKNLRVISKGDFFLAGKRRAMSFSLVRGYNR